MNLNEENVDERHIELENAVIGKLLDGDDPVLEALRQQFELSRVAKRMFSGFGFITDFIVPQDIPPVEAKSLFFLSDVTADLNGQPEAAGFHIQVKNGRMKLLEGFTYNDPWPMQLFSFDVTYKYPPALAQAHPDRDRNERLLDWVRDQWQKS